MAAATLEIDMVADNLELDMEIAFIGYKAQRRQISDFENLHMPAFEQHRPQVKGL